MRQKQYPMVMNFLSAAFLAASGLSACQAIAAEHYVTPDMNLQEIISSAASGDRVHLAAGNYRTSLVIDKALTLQGEPETLIQGNGEGHVITVNAPGTVIRSLNVQGSGRDIEKLDSGIFIARTATGSLVENNRLEENLYGIYIHGANDAIVQNNIILGYKEGRRADAGNGIAVWNAPGAKVIGNQIYYGRDGIYVQASRKNVFQNNVMRNSRFAIHYMYADDSEISNNISMDNNVGFAIMFSSRLIIRDNVSKGDRDHGVLLNYANYSKISGNVVLGQLLSQDRWLRGTFSGHGVPSNEPREPVPEGKMRIGPEKCVFIYNANNNSFWGNWFENCNIGVHFTAGSEGNTLWDNAFINNRAQVKYVSTRYIDWTSKERGNYWSDNPAFDLNGDGIADTAYRPNDVIDKVLWTTPQAKVLVNSPSVQIIRWAQSQFPAISPGGVIDSRPLMTPPKKTRFIIPPLVNGQ